MNIAIDKMGKAGFLRQFCLGLFLLLLSQMALAQALALEQIPSTMLGRSLGLLVEQEGQLDLAQAIRLQQEGRFQAGNADVPKFGIGARPVWLHLAVNNTGSSTVSRRLVAEVSWMDRIEFYQLHAGQVVATRLAGDADASQQHPVAGLGYVFDLNLPPGQTDIYLRNSTADPMVLPIRLLSPEDSESLSRQYSYGYGLLYGILLALIAYNATLYIGLRDRSHLDYSLYLGAFVLLNLAYTGHGYAWLWPNLPDFQQYIILALMVLYGCFGLRFASGFLNLAKYEPRLNRLAHRFAYAGLLLIALTIVLKRQPEAVLVSFVFILLFSVGMVWLGIVTVRHGRVAGRYFLAAALAAMLGATISDLAVWVGLPFSPLTFHAAGWGAALEGILLALALAARMRRQELARLQAEQMARTDLLTGLLNRRAFLERAEPLWSTARRNGRPLSAIMADLDFFKAINDVHGHAMGDQALQDVGLVLSEACRSGDIAARWGGEEFILLLPETDAAQAAALAERLRQQISKLRLDDSGALLPLTASFGIAEQQHQTNLHELIRDADQRLYEAKEAGRNRVCGGPKPAPQPI